MILLLFNLYMNAKLPYRSILSYHNKCTVADILNMRPLRLSVLKKKMRDRYLKLRQSLAPPQEDSFLVAWVLL